MQKENRIRSIFFDAVGTVIHPDPPAVAVYSAVAHRFGSKLDAACIQQSFNKAFARQEQQDHGAGWRTSEAREIERWRTIVGDVLGDVAEKEACFALLYEHFSKPEHWRCEASAADIVAQLRERGVTVGLASNFDHRLRDVEAGLPALADIQLIVISSEVGWRKPAAEFYDNACKAAGARADETLYVGDDIVNDYEGALAAGCSAILFDPAGRAPNEAHSIRHLSAVLERL